MNGVNLKLKKLKHLSSFLIVTVVLRMIFLFYGTTQNLTYAGCGFEYPSSP